MKGLSLTCIFGFAAAQSAAITANSACVTNSGGYDVYWWYYDVVTGDSSPSSGSYPIDQTRCMSMDQLANLQDGDFVQVMAHAVAGVTTTADPALVYSSNSTEVVTFVCSGTTLGIHCAAPGYAPHQELPELTEDFLQ